MRWKPLPLAAGLYLGAVAVVLGLAIWRPGALVVVAVVVLLLGPGRWWRWRTRRFRRGVRAIRRGDLAAGRGELEAFLEQIRDDPRFDRLQPLFNLGKRYSYRAAALSNLGVADISSGRADRALERFEQALAIDPGSVQAQFGVGLARRQAGDLAGAARAADRALMIRPGYLPARLLLALARRESGDRRCAEAALEPLREDGADPEELLARFVARWGHGRGE